MQDLHKILSPETSNSINTYLFFLQHKSSLFCHCSVFFICLFPPPYFRAFSHCILILIISQLLCISIILVFLTPHFQDILSKFSDRTYGLIQSTSGLPIIYGAKLFALFSKAFKCPSYLFFQFSHLLQSHNKICYVC